MLGYDWPETSGVEVGVGSSSSSNSVDFDCLEDSQFWGFNDLAETSSQNYCSMTRQPNLMSSQNLMKRGVEEAILKIWRGFG